MVIMSQNQRAISRLTDCKLSGFQRLNGSGRVGNTSVQDTVRTIQMVNVWNESANATLLKAIELKSEAKAELVKLFSRATLVN